MPQSNDKSKEIITTPDYIGEAIDAADNERTSKKSVIEYTRELNNNPRNTDGPDEV